MKNKVYIDTNSVVKYSDLETGEVFRFVNGSAASENLYIRSILNGHPIAVLLNSGVAYEPQKHTDVLRSKRGDKVAISVGMGE